MELALGARAQCLAGSNPAIGIMLRSRFKIHLIGQPMFQIHIPVSKKATVTEWSKVPALRVGVVLHHRRFKSCPLRFNRRQRSHKW